MLQIDPDKPMTREESYVERRELFKNIWMTALEIHETEDIMNKPKLIKTLRMDDIDKCPIGKTKKQRIKNLRHVCNRILDFCDRQEANDKFYEQIAAHGTTSPTAALQKKKLRTRVRRKVRKAKSILVSRNNEVTVARASISEGANSSDHSVPQIKRKTFKTKSADAPKKSVKIKSNKYITSNKTGDFTAETIKVKHKILKKKRNCKKKVKTLHILSV